MTILQPAALRFAPSPSGFLHLGHAYSALFSRAQAQALNGRFLLRIEDIDTTRCRKHFEDAIYEDLNWLGIKWDEPVRIQSQHMDDYKKALKKLEDKNLIYPCFCTRKEIRTEIEQSGKAPHGPDGLIYPGICKKLSANQRQDKINNGQVYALRLDMNKSIELAGSLFWHDISAGRIKAAPEEFGDVVLARKDISTSYHLSVTVDDALQGITCITRGKDLFEATHIHRLLQALLELPVPNWHHHDLICDDEGNRLAKRYNALSIRELKEKGHTAKEVLAMAGV
ncbi:MAG: tRNA glutamyl-Q(34) synthetase GluQRS [Halopseudomonas aestusnigri]